MPPACWWQPIKASAASWQGFTCQVCAAACLLRQCTGSHSLTGLHLLENDVSCSSSLVVHWLQTQIRKGFSRVEASLDDVVLDLPKAREDLAKLKQQALKEGWLVAES